MPELFPSIPLFILCALIVAAAQLIYATAGFGAGMFSVALLALVLPDLAGAVATLLLITLVTEITVLARAWRQANLRLLLGLLPTTAIGMWLGTEWLAGGDTSGLRRLLGGVVAAAGLWFLFEAWTHHAIAAGNAPPAPRRMGWGRAAWSVPAGLVAGTLAGLFGTGGPPVIIFLRSFRLDKGAFRATLLWYFLLMSALRVTTYVRAGLLTGNELRAAAWLLPGAIAGTALGMIIHGRLSERRFAQAVAGLLVLLGALLVLGR
jgi:uncharacterized membrane protein YfcA